MRLDEGLLTLRRGLLSPFRSPHKPTGTRFQLWGLMDRTKGKNNELTEHRSSDHASLDVQVGPSDGLSKVLRSRNATGRRYGERLKVLAVILSHVAGI